MNLFHILAVILMTIGLIPPVVIELQDARNVLNGIFMATCGMLFIGGVVSAGRQSLFCFFEKGIAATGIVLSLCVGGINYYRGTFYPEGYKFILLFLVIFVGEELYRHIAVERLVGDYTAALAVFVMAVFGTSLFIPQDNILKEVGPGGLYERLDITGSVTTLAIFATTFLLIVPAKLAACRNLKAKAAYLLAILAALYLQLFSASRQSVLIFLICLGILLFAGKDRNVRTSRSKIIFFLLAGVAIFTLFTIFVNDSFYVRLFENPSEDYTSGRFNSMSLWFDEMAEKGGPLGFGYINSHTIPEIELLWPHNEFARFYLEGGIIGVGIIMLLFIYTLVVLRIVLSHRLPQSIRMLVAAIASVMFVQVMLENMFHHIHRTTFWFLLLSLSAHHGLKMRDSPSCGVESDRAQ